MSDELTWKPRTIGEDNWRARNATDDGTYIVGAYEAPVFTVVGIFRPDSLPPEVKSKILYESSTGGTFAEAKDACQDHHYAACRSERWRIHMRDNEPPSVHVP